MDIELIVALRDVVNDWIGDNSDNTEWPQVYFGEDLAENMAMGAVAVFDMSIDTAKYYQKEICPEEK